jgi:hypothetical protein
MDMAADNKDQVKILMDLLLLNLLGGDETRIIIKNPLNKNYFFNSSIYKIKIQKLFNKK